MSRVLPDSVLDFGRDRNPVRHGQKRSTQTETFMSHAVSATRTPSFCTDGGFGEGDARMNHSPDLSVGLERSRGLVREHGPGRCEVDEQAPRGGAPEFGANSVCLIEDGMRFASGP
jgi:hypothetical protein